MNGTFEISGSSMGDGSYYRYTDINVNDVRMKERIAAGKGTMDTSENIVLKAEDFNITTSILEKYPGGQIYSASIHEIWPVNLSAARSMDYIGKGISDREVFGNNFDYVGTSYLYTTDLRKDRSCMLDLKETWSVGNVTDDPEEVPLITPYQFLPAKRTDYRIESRSTGLVDLRYGQVADHITLNEGEETYSGTFEISRRISMESPLRNETLDDVDWLSCCLDGTSNVRWPWYEDDECIFGE